MPLIANLRLRTGGINFDSIVLNILPHQFSIVWFHRLRKEEVWFSSNRAPPYAEFRVRGRVNKLYLMHFYPIVHHVGYHLLSEIQNEKKDRTSSHMSFHIPLSRAFSGAHSCIKPYKGEWSIKCRKWHSTSVLVERDLKVLFSSQKVDWKRLDLFGYET